MDRNNFLYLNGRSVADQMGERLYFVYGEVITNKKEMRVLDLWKLDKRGCVAKRKMKRKGPKKLLGNK